MKITLLIALFGVGLISSFSQAGQVREVICETEDELIPSMDCTKYYQCSNFEPILVSCPPPLYFNTGLEACDFPQNVTDCNDEGIRDSTGGPTDGTTPIITTPAATTETPEETPTEAIRTTTGQGSTESDPPTTTNPGSPVTSEPGVCPPDGVVSIAYPGNCSLYYLCVNGDPTVMQCADGLLFDPILAKCNLAEEVDCQDATTTTAPEITTGSSGVECPVEGIVFLPDPTDCKKYYICANGGEPISQECADGLLFDPILGQCNTASEVECNIRPECPEEGIAYLPLPGTCTEYLMCVSGEAIEMECVDGTEFDPEQGKCVLEENYECPYAKRSRSMFFFWRK